MSDPTPAEAPNDFRYSLANKALAAFVDPRRFLFEDGQRLPHALLDALAPETRRMASAIRESRRFALDRRFLYAMAGERSDDIVETIGTVLSLARCPHPKVFVEFSTEDHLALHRRLVRDPNWSEVEVPDSDGTPTDRVGFLIERVDPADPTLWTATKILEDGRGVHVEPLSFVVSTGERAVPDLAGGHRVIDFAAYGGDPAYHHSGIGFVQLGRPSPIPGWEDAARFAYSRFFLSNVAFLERLGTSEDAALREAMVQGTRYNVGMILLVCRILATMNEMPTKETEVLPGPKRLLAGKRVPMLPYVRLSLRRKVTPRQLDEELDRAARREHDVRGHWRTLKAAPDGTARRTWVSEHRRGTGEAMPSDRPVTGISVTPVHAGNRFARVMAMRPLMGILHRLFGGKPARPDA